MTDLPLDDLDRDGALVEAFDGLHARTRADLLRGAVVGSVALLTAVAAPAGAEEHESPRDISILNFMLALEELQAVFYTEVERNRILHGRWRTRRSSSARTSAPMPAPCTGPSNRTAKQPRFDFGGATEGAAAFQRTAVAFEDLSVAAYKAQVPRIVEREYLTSAMAIHSVEARHAAWIRRLAGQPPVAGPFDEPISRATTTRIVDRTHFVVRTTSRRGPRFTG